MKNTKQKILDALKEEKELRCPFCNNNVFIRKHLQKVSLVDDGEEITDIEVDSWMEFQYKCAKCGKDITEEELK